MSTTYEYKVSLPLTVTAFLRTLTALPREPWEVTRTGRIRRCRDRACPIIAAARHKHGDTAPDGYKLTNGRVWYAANLVGMDFKDGAFAREAAVLLVQAADNRRQSYAQPAECRKRIMEAVGLAL